MEAKITQIKKDVLVASYESGACHIGSALSCVGILVDLFYNKLGKDDVFVFSKASGVAAFYAILADTGYFPKEKLVEYLKNYPLPSKEVTGVIHSMGSLGHGLSLACGLALGDRNRKVYVLLSDGECQEGSTMEAVLFARQHKLDNLFVIIDHNRLQALGYTDEILKIDFDFYTRNLPHCEVVVTTKGDGVDFMEDDNSWHYRNLDVDQLEECVCQI